MGEEWRSEDWTGGHPANNTRWSRDRDVTRTHRVLDELLEDARALRVVEEDLTKPRGEVHLLPEVIPLVARDVHRCWAPLSVQCVNASSDGKEHVFF